MLASKALVRLLSDYDFETVLDIGSGAGAHASVLEQHGKRVTTCDLGSSEYYESRSFDATIRGDYLTTVFSSPFDCIWCSHILEHQRNVGMFLEKVHGDLVEGGVLAITVPPRKKEIVGGHLTLWNAGLLLYNLVLAGFDCARARVKQYDYNISVLVRKRTIDVSSLSLDYDIGDIEKLAPYFPFPVRQGFDGDVTDWDWDVPHPRESIRSPASRPIPASDAIAIQPGRSPRASFKDLMEQCRAGATRNV